MTKLGNYYIYADETCQTGHRFMVIGGVLCAPNCARIISREIDDIKRGFGQLGPIKWKRLRRSKLPRYKAVVDCFFDFNKEHAIDFSALVVNASTLDHKFYRSDPETTFNKFIFQHLLSHARKYKPRSHFSCFLHQRHTGTSNADLRNMLNATCFKMGYRFLDPFNRVEHRPLEQENLLQLSDVLIGAIGHTMNEKTSPPEKIELADHIRASARLDSLKDPTPASARHFDIWHFTSRDRGAPWA